MKKLRLSFFGVLAILSVSSFAQSSDIGYDWDTSKEDPDKLIASTSGASFVENQLTYTVNFGLDNQVNFEVGGSGLSRAASHNAVYISNSSYPSSTAFSYAQMGNGINAAFFEGYVKSDREISAIKFNGATASTSNATEGGILFSDATPFDESKVTGYSTISFPACRAGGNGVTLSSEIPVGTKSFRLYGRAQVVPSSTDGYYEVKDSETDGEGNTITLENAIVIGNGVASVRLAYVNVTTKTSTSSIESVNAENKVVISKSYYDLTGRPLSDSSAKGVMIQKSIYEDGSISFDKIYIK